MSSPMKLPEFRAMLSNSGSVDLVETSKLSNEQLEKLLACLKSLDFSDRHRPQ